MQVSREILLPSRRREKYIFSEGKFDMYTFKKRNGFQADNKLKKGVTNMIQREHTFQIYIAFSFFGF